MKHRDPERIIKLYNWLWLRAINNKSAPFSQLQPSTWTGRAISLLVPQIIKIKQAMQSRAYRDAVSKIIHSN